MLVADRLDDKVEVRAQLPRRRVAHVARHRDAVAQVAERPRGLRGVDAVGEARPRGVGPVEEGVDGVAEGGIDEGERGRVGRRVRVGQLRRDSGEARAAEAAARKLSS